jgi:GxxExxY protein
MKTELLYKDETHEIRAAIFEVYHEMGSGFLESVYQECLEKEFAAQKIPYQSKTGINLHYKDMPLEQKYIPDFICYDKIIIEIKATVELASEHRAQILNYLKASKLRVGLLVNFGKHSKAQIERFVL